MSAGAGLGRALVAQAQPNPFGASWVALVVGADGVSDDFGDWASVGFRSAIAAGTRDLVLAEARWQRAFGDRGVYGGLGLRHAFGSRWFATISAGGGTGRFYFPDLRLDGAIHLKWLPRANLVSTLGVMYLRSKDVYRDRAAYLSLAAYLGETMVVEAGARMNWSDPGSEGSGRGFGVLTVGRNRRRYAVLRAGAGRESYQLVGAVSALRSFASEEIGFELQQWTSPHWGFQLGVEWYHNPFYARTGARLGLFRHW